MQRTNELSLPILEIVPEGILTKNGDFTVCYQLTKPPLFSLSPAQLETWHQAWVKAISSLPFDTVIHISDECFPLKWYPNDDIASDAAVFLSVVPDVDKSLLRKASDSHFCGRPYLYNKTHLYITKRASRPKAVHSGLSSLITGSLVPEAVLQPRQMQAFIDKCARFSTILTDSKLVQLRLLTVDEMGSEAEPGIVEKYYGLKREGPELTDIQFIDGFKIGARECAMYTLADAGDLPSQCSPWTPYGPYSTDNIPFPIGFATALGPLLHTWHTYNQYIFIEDPKKTLAEMETRRKRLKSLSGYSRENAFTSEAIGQYLEEAATGQRQPVRAHFNIVVVGWDREELRALGLRASAAITRIGAIPHHETIGAPQIWWAGIPGNAGDFPMNDTFDTFVEQAACLLIPEGDAVSSSSPFNLRLGERHHGVPLAVDISDEPMRKGWINNRNKFVLGGSGSGKSVYMNHLGASYYEQGAHIVIVDIGGSYQGLCELVDGQYFAYSDNHPIRFNPFRIESDQEPDSEKKESLKALLQALWKKSDEPFRRSEYVALSNALHGYYKQLKSNPAIIACFDTFYEFLRDIYSAKLGKEKISREDFDLDNLLYVLKPYYKDGEYDYLLNATDLPSLLDQRMIVFELDTIKDHPILFPVVTIIIMEVFISKMRNLQGIRKVLVIEEAWKAIAKEGMSEYIKYLFKTVRKFFGEAIVVTQDIDDIVSSPIVKDAIINNSDCKILLDQSKFINRFDQIQSLLGLTAHDKTLALSLNRANDPARKYKEVFIGMANGPSSVYRVELSLEEYLVYTTEEKEKVMVRKYTADYGGIREGVAALAAAIRSGAVKFLLIFAMASIFTLAPTRRASAQALEVAEIIEAAVKKAIMTADLEIQRLQTETIALQNAQKQVENAMAGDLLGDITGWVQQQENLYGGYYQELWQVKSALSAYTKTATLIQRQTQLVKEEQQDWAAVQKDPHFSTAELSHIGAVYTAILNESSRSIQQIRQIITAFVTQMDDANRLHIIDQTNKGIDTNYQDLRTFTQQNSLLSLERAKDEADVLTIKTLYNLP
jgi:conjugation system TraG family ATPase